MKVSRRSTDLSLFVSTRHTGTALPEKTSLAQGAAVPIGRRYPAIATNPFKRNRRPHLNPSFSIGQRISVPSHSSFTGKSLPHSPQRARGASRTMAPWPDSSRKSSASAGNRTAVTISGVAMCSSYHWGPRIFSRDQSIRVRSWLAVARSVPSGLKARALIESWWPLPENPRTVSPLTACNR